ncbi:MAG TPA: hypothetical protein VE174_03660 [Actinomycetota bacterium]|nr:hypothetical protein [Actinomycetota bacterium]
MTEVKEMTEATAESDPRTWNRTLAALGAVLLLFAPACEANIDTDEDGVETEDEGDVDLDDDDVDVEEDTDVDVEVDEDEDL